ncbi:50S ribosomal protein L4 [Candidatus Bathycorpusculum sp.]|uniref:50S ribosomal protein L4 n=1 Tax=Candidatus Bathycorpusculum sp. TaxID=2994959 RepID=UPI00283829BD|nr:50S ribosomal protein L4 [Candidatus Termitimicrobium sp.]
MAQKTAEIFDLQGKAKGTITLPAVFQTPLRPDVIKRAVLAIQSKRIQPQGRDPMAGKKTTAESRGTGSGIARVPRVKGGSGKAAFAPSTVKGRQPHPPRVEKIIVKDIPKKEAKLALISAIAATSEKEVVAARGHKVDTVIGLPLVVEDTIEGLSKTKEVEEVFASFGFDAELTRVRDSRSVRAGKGKRRGRKMKQAVGPLIVVVDDKSLANAASNIPGVQVATVNSLNTEMLAPGTHPGRLTVWTSGAIDKLTTLYGESA